MPDQDQDAIGYRPTERDKSLEAMAEAQHQRLIEQGDIVDGPAVEAPEPAATVEPEPPKVEDQVAKQMRKVKVDGEEIEVSEDDLVASYRHQETTRREMTRAQQARAEAERLLAEAQANVPKEPAPDRAAKVKEYHDALFEGDVEKATALFDEVMTTGRQEPPLDVKSVIDQALPVMKQQLSNESALERFTTDYQDILGDGVLTQVAQTELRRLEAEGKPYGEALFEAGNRARNWLKSKMPPAPNEQPTTTRAEKLDKKAGIVNFPTANAKAASAQEREQTDSEYIAEMRKRRGLG